MTGAEEAQGAEGVAGITGGKARGVRLVSCVRKGGAKPVEGTGYCETRVREGEPEFSV